MTEATEKSWYIFKHDDGHCEISQIDPGEGSAPGDEVAEAAPREQWGPFETEDEATARRVGLIRSGKCLPA